MAKMVMLQRKITTLERKLLRERRLTNALYRQMIQSYSGLIEPLEKLADALMRSSQENSAFNEALGNDSNNHTSKN